MSLLFPRATSGVTREIRGETLTFYPVRVWSVWSKHLRMLGGLLGAVSDLVAVMSSKPKGETISSESPGADAFYHSKPASYQAQAAWGDRLSAAMKKIVDEAGKDGVIEAFCLTVLDSLRDPNRPATKENAMALADELDSELLLELGIGLFSASLQNLSTPLKAWVQSVTNSIKTTVRLHTANLSSGLPESQESESLTS